MMKACSERIAAMHPDSQIAAIQIRVGLINRIKYSVAPRSSAWTFADREGGSHAPGASCATTLARFSKNLRFSALTGAPACPILSQSKPRAGLGGNLSKAQKMTQTMIAATYHGIRVPQSPYITEKRVQQMEALRYEGQEIAGALALVRPGDRVLEMGAGLGIVGAVIARVAKPSAILSYEANPELLPHIRTLHAENGLSDVIELRNQILISGSDRPDNVTFYIQKNSFLGSSLIEKPTRASRPVSVPTADLNAVIEDFRPDVLVIDIEGAELGLLQNTRLTGVRSVIIEFHPAVYELEGVRTCKRRLKKLGFDKRADHSTPFVWACERSAVQPKTNNFPPRPDGGWSHTLRTVENAVVKAQAHPYQTPSGVQDAEGHDVPEGALWEGKQRRNLPFERPDPVAETIDGTWLWGGTLWLTFSHFIAESLVRLWGLEAAQQKIDGILYMPARPGRWQQRSQLESYQKDVFAALGVELPIRAITDSARVERLIVPGQGFGLGEITAGTPAFRAFMRNRFGRDIAPEGGDKLYISRSGMAKHRHGAPLCEERIEAALKAEGYEIFYPERHDIRTQIARYKAARQVVATEGSALHMLAHLSCEDQRVAVILRRRSGSSLNLLRHIEAFSGNAPLAVDALRAIWQPAGSDRARMSLAEIDLPALQDQLRAGGFIAPKGPRWKPLSLKAVREDLPSPDYVRTMMTS